MTGPERNAELSRAALLVAGGGALVAIPQRMAEGGAQPLAMQIAVVAGAVVIGIGLVLALRILMRRGNR